MLPEHTKFSPLCDLRPGEYNCRLVEQRESETYLVAILEVEDVGLRCHFFQKPHHKHDKVTALACQSALAEFENAKPNMVASFFPRKTHSGNAFMVISLRKRMDL